MDLELKALNRCTTGVVTRTSVAVQAVKEDVVVPRDIYTSRR